MKEGRGGTKKIDHFSIKVCIVAVDCVLRLNIKFFATSRE